MGSQETLVNPSPPLSLFFSPDSMKSALVSPPAAYPLYRIHSASSGYRTEITNARTTALVAIIERRDIFPDRVTFPERYGGRPLKLRKWLRSAKLPNQFPVTLLDTDDGPCLWKSDPTRRLGFYAVDDLTTPLAYFLSATASSPPQLVCAPGTENIRDVIVTSLAVLEQEMRMREKNDLTAKGMGARHASALGGRIV